MAGDGQDRACALGWGEGFHPNRPKTIARYHTIPQLSYKCFKSDQVGHTGYEMNQQLTKFT